MSRGDTAGLMSRHVAKSGSSVAVYDRAAVTSRRNIRQSRFIYDAASKREVGERREGTTTRAERKRERAYR